MADQASDDRHALLAAAARAVTGDAGVGDVRNYLQAYYRHVAVEDLVSAGPKRLAAVANEQARVAAHRAQGRALVPGRRGEAPPCPPARGLIATCTRHLPGP